MILCLPGALGSTRSDFGTQLNGLSIKFTVVAFDPRGYGAICYEIFVAVVILSIFLKDQIFS